MTETWGRWLQEAAARIEALEAKQETKNGVR